LYVNAAGNVSTYVRVPVVGVVPMFPTLSEYVPVPPLMKFPECVLFACRTGAPPTVVGSVAVGELVVPPPVAFTEFVTLGTAAARTLTLSVIAFAFAAAAIAVVDVHVTVCPLAPHAQPVPDAELYVSPVGSVSMTVTVPLVGEPPGLLATIVYVPVEPTVKLPTWDLAMASAAGAGSIVVGSFAVAEFVAPPPDAVALLVSVPGVDVVTLTVMPTVAPTEDGAIAAVDVQVTLCPAFPHVQPVPVAAT